MKKRSAASSLSKLLDPPTFFLDRSLGKKTIANVLRAEGIEVQVHDDHFLPDTADSVWLSEVGRRGWFVFTKDRKIRYRRLETTALAEAGVGAFVLTAGDLQGVDMANAFLAAMPAIRKFIESNARPFVATLSRGGSLRKIL